jgi:hypothetical protein
MTATVLIIGRVGRLRDGLCTILRTFPGIMQVRAVDGFESAFEQLAFEFSSVVIVDGDERLENACPFLKRMFSTYSETRYIVIANTLHQRAMTQELGADAVLLRGFSTSALYGTLVSLAIIPDSGYIGGRRGMNPSQTTAVLTLQKP